MSSKTEKTIEWTKELLFGLKELVEFSLDPRVMVNVSSITRMGYGQWKDRQAFFEQLRERRKVLLTRKDSSQKIFRALQDLEKRNVIAIDKKKNQFKISMSAKGILKLLRFFARQHSKPKQWDGKWRIVVFDIPEKYKPTREMLRRYLYALGFSQIQKSVFATKQNLLKDVRRLMRVCEMEPFTQYFVATEWRPSEEDQYE